MVLSPEPAGATASRPSKGNLLLVVLAGLILITGIFIAVFYLTSSHDTGVSVVRMEGTLVTGELSGKDLRMTRWWRQSCSG